MQHKFGFALVEIALQIDHQSLRNRSPRGLKSLCKSTTYLEAWEDDKWVFSSFCICGGGQETSSTAFDSDSRKCIQKSVCFSISLVNHLIFTSIRLFLIFCRQFIHQHSNIVIPIDQSIVWISFITLLRPCLIFYLICGYTS